MRSMSSDERLIAYTSFRHVGGSVVPLSTLRDGIAELPLDGVLGALGALSVESIQDAERFFDPRRQGSYLNQAIADDFPEPLPGAARMYSPGRVPATGTSNLFLHEHNLAWLAHVALLRADDAADTPEISFSLQSRLLRLLLIVNDYLGAEVSWVENLRSRRQWAGNLLRQFQFNRFQQGLFPVLLSLARHHRILAELVPDRFPEFPAIFEAASGGTTLDVYFDALILLATHVYEGMTADTRWLARASLLRNLFAHEEDVRRVIDRWTTTPGGYRAAWRARVPVATEEPPYDFLELRSSPIIEARPGELIVPSLPLLLARIENDAYFLVSEHLTDERERNRFQSALGEAYELYCDDLVGRVATVTLLGGKGRLPKPTAGEHELGDDYLQRDRVAVVFEHKAQRPGVAFEGGGELDRVLGPGDALLELIEQSGPIAFEEGRRGDNGLFTRPMWQQNRHAKELLEYAEARLGDSPTTVYPLITTLASLQVDAVVRAAYLAPLIEAAGLYRQPAYEDPQWIRVDELEVIVSLAEQGIVDFVDLLALKSRDACAERFDVFLHSRYGAQWDDHLYRRGRGLLERSKDRFFAGG
jgi:hypothetical protein